MQALSAKTAVAGTRVVSEGCWAFFGWPGRSERIE